LAKLTANEKNLVKFVGGLIGEPFPTLPEVTIDDAYIGASGIIVEYSKKNKSIETKFKKQFPKFMKEYFNGIFELAGGLGIKTSTGIRVTLNAIGGGKRRRAINTKVQEEGTTVVFNQVLKNNKRFKTEDSILADAATAAALKKTFKKHGGFEDMLKEWTWTYWQQQHNFFEKYEDSKWDEFKYEGENFTDFFRGLLRKVEDEPRVKVGKYETWNPSDIWAAYDMPAVKKELDKNLKPTIKLAELNGLLIDLFKDNKLVGVSLKKVLYGQDAHLKLVNVDTKTMKLGDIETYEMPHVKLQIGAIFTGETVTTYIKFGNDSAYKININGDTGKSSNLKWNTQISATPAAQGGQSPTEQVMKLMKKKPGYKGTFVNDWRKFPLDADTFWDESDKWEKMYNLVSSTYKGPSAKYEDWKKYISGLYSKNKKYIVAVKLMQLHFFYDAIDNYGRDVEFWTDLLYLGMKVGKRFAPHAKIS
tara:strand:- start:1362 stop:2786 length:1425 start_codon:yes stop_codon:yes gene_type:complete